METSLILIIGGSSLLGKKLCAVLSECFRIIPTFHKQPLQSGVQLDISNRKEVINVLREYHPDTVILLAGYTDVDKCQKRKNLCWNLNVEASRAIIAYCQRERVKLVYFSSDYVFDGENSPYQKWDKRSPLSFYGLVKKTLEDIIIESLDNFLIIRLDILYGYNDQFDKVTYPVEVLKKLKQGKTIKAESTRIRYPTLIDDVAFLVRDLIKKNKTGLIQASSSEGVSRYEWALKIAEAFNLNKDSIKPFRRRSRIRPHDPGMILDPEVNFHTIEEGLRIMKEQMERPLKVGLDFDGVIGNTYGPARFYIKHYVKFKGALIRAGLWWLHKLIVMIFFDIFPLMLDSKVIDLLEPENEYYLISGRVSRENRIRELASRYLTIKSFHFRGTRSLDSAEDPVRGEVEWKVEKCKELGISLFIEDNQYVAESMRKRGVNVLEVENWKLARLGGVSSERCARARVTQLGD